MAAEAPGEGNRGDLRPIPDPTALTKDAIEQVTVSYRREMFQLRELLETRLAAMDKATELLATAVNRAAAETDRAIMVVRELLEVRIDGMDQAGKLLAVSMDKVPGNIEKSSTGLKQVLDTRLAGMDEATRLLATNVDKVPYAILQEAGNLKAFIMSRIDDVSHVTAEKFNAVDALFGSNATALTAALAAQEKAVAAQNDSNTLAITKSEQATKETITANAAQTTTGLQGLSTTMDDLKSRIVRLEGQMQSARLSSEDSLSVSTFSQTAEANRMAASRATIQLAIAGVSALVAIVAVLFAVLHK